MRFLWALIALLGSEPLLAGAYSTDLNFGQTEDAVNHPVLYVGTGGVRTIRVCLDPQIADVDQREPLVLRAIGTWNALTPSANNLTGDVPQGLVDFESAVIHELGHCMLGLAHPNLGLTQDVTAGQASQADPGGNGVFDVGFGSDKAPGTGDDVRGDDVNRVWFYTADNYPYLLTLPVDSTVYSRDLGDLPPGEMFAANPNRLSGPESMPPTTDTEAVMNAYTRTNEGRRTLQHDDVATALYAASGIDEMATTADDYTVQTVYQGRTTSGCDVLIEDLTEGEPGVAGMCNTAAILIGGSTQHYRLAGVSTVQISDEVDWYYGPEVFADGFETGNTAEWSGTVP